MGGGGKKGCCWVSSRAMLGLGDRGSARVVGRRVVVERRM